ncbi:MAG: hypothetical protein N4A45_07770 [Flavobacteriales bacterium]|jgi:hypothetical protein|nr:hypothetical protein [Flavobacteriales bacterium]
MKKSIAILILFFISVSVFAQSPWTQKKNKAFINLSYSFINNYDKIFGLSEEIATTRTYSDQTIQLYGEYGITDKITLLIGVPFKMVSLKDQNNDLEENLSSLGNASIGIKHNFYQKNFLFSGQLEYSSNMNSTGNLGLRTGYDSHAFSALGIIGKGHSKWFAQGFAGMIYRTNDYSSHVKIGGEYGRKIKNVWLILFLDGLVSLKNGDRAHTMDELLSSLYVNDQSFSGWGLKVLYETKSNLGFVGSFGGAFSGNNVPKKAALSLGIYKKL